MLYIYVGQHVIKALHVSKSLLGQYSVQQSEKKFSVQLLKAGKVAHTDIVASAIKEVIYHLTGGAAKVAGLEELARATLRIPIRIGQPMGVYGITDVLHDPSNATGVGLALWGVRHQGKPAWEDQTQKSGTLSGFVDVLKKFFGLSK